MRRAKYGIGAVVVVGLAWFLSNVFNWDLSGLHLGQNGTSQSETARDDPEPANRSDEDGNRKVDDTRKVSTDVGEAAIGGDGSLDVRIEDHAYFLRNGSGAKAEWVPADLDKIVALAKRAPGDDIGVRVRVIRGPSARASAEDALSSALLSAGLETSEIIKTSNLIDEKKPVFSVPDS